MFRIALLQFLLQSSIRVGPKPGEILGHLNWPLIGGENFHHQWLPDELVGEPFGLSGDTQRALISRGHKLGKLRYLGDAEGIMIEDKTGVRLGATDPRRSDGLAVGY